MDVATVERWARDQGVTDEQFQAFYDDALTLAGSRLLQTAYREHYPAPTELRRGCDNHWSLETGTDLVIRVPVAPPLPFGRLEATGLPQTRAASGGQTIRTAASFLHALRIAWRDAHCPFDRLAKDFENSLANLVLNRAMFACRPADAPMVEPSFGGHNYYPFPALRDEVSLEEIITCSHISGDQTALPLIVLRKHRFVSVEQDDEAACFHSWSGLPTADWLPGMLPLHPWQVRKSDVFKSARIAGLVELLPEKVAATPLASQRTCRIGLTGYDLKLPIDVTLTGERRLLYPANALNAPVVSALVKAVHRSIGSDSIGFQYDVASLAFPDDVIGSHLAAIVRSPLPARADINVVPALMLWSAPHLAEELLQLEKGGAAVDFFRGYCRLVMRDPVEWHAQWGISFEPHLQNSLIEIHAGRPVRLLLRDLDATILDPERVPALLREHGLNLPIERWDVMPTVADGGRRLLHSLFYAHLGEVSAFLIQRFAVEPSALADCVDKVWGELLQSHTGATRRRIVELRELANPVKRLLALRMQRSMDMSWATVEPPEPVEEIRRRGTRGFS